MQLPCITVLFVILTCILATLLFSPLYQAAYKFSGVTH